MSWPKVWSTKLTLSGSDIGDLPCRSVLNMTWVHLLHTNTFVTGKEHFVSHTLNTDIFTIYHILQIGTHPKTSYSVVSALYDYHSSINKSVVVVVVVVVVINERINIIQNRIIQDSLFDLTLQFCKCWF